MVDDMKERKVKDEASRQTEQNMEVFEDRSILVTSEAPCSLQAKKKLQCTEYKTTWQ